MVKQEHLKLCAFALRAATLLQRAFCDHLSILIAQFQVLLDQISDSPCGTSYIMTYYCLSRSKHELLIQLS